MSYKAVLFDMDGTLLDTLEDLRDSTNHVLRQMGYPERSLEEMRRFVGNGAEKQIRRAVPEGTNEEKIMEVLTAYRAYYQDHCQIKTRVYDGLLDMLSELKAKGIKLAVVSNKPDSAVQKLSREYFGDRMDFAVGPSDGVRCKPYPDMAETALKALGIAKKDAVFVGDSEVDVQTGLNAGLDVIAVSWGRCVAWDILRCRWCCRSSERLVREWCGFLAFFHTTDHWRFCSFLIRHRGLSRLFYKSSAFIL